MTYEYTVCSFITLIQIVVLHDSKTIINAFNVYYIKFYTPSRTKLAVCLTGWFVFVFRVRTEKQSGSVRRVRLLTTEVPWSDVTSVTTGITGKTQKFSHPKKCSWHVCPICRTCVGITQEPPADESWFCPKHRVSLPPKRSGGSSSSSKKKNRAKGKSAKKKSLSWTSSASPQPNCVQNFMCKNSYLHQMCNVLGPHLVASSVSSCLSVRPFCPFARTIYN